jgi:hypothetical protein
MANEVKLVCGLTLYDILWKPRGYAKENRPLLVESLKILLKDPQYYKKFNPKNRFGSYENLVAVVRNIILACKEYPEARLEAWV